MLEALSQCQKAIRDTVVVRATGDALRRLSKLWGVPMPTAWDEASWREGVNAVGLGPRATPGTTFAFLEGIFQYAEQTVEVTLDPANPQRLTATAGAGTFTDDHVERFVRISGAVAPGLYRVVGPSNVAADGGSKVELAKIGTSYWNGADWSGFAVTETVDAVFLAYTISEKTPGPEAPASLGEASVYRVGLAVVTAVVPPSYLQPDVRWLLYDAEAAPFTAGETVTGAISGASALLRRKVDNGATGALELALIRGGPGPFQDNEQITGSLGGDATVNGTVAHLLVAYDGEAGGGFTVGDTVDGTAAVDPMEATVSGLQDDGAAGTLALQYVLGQPVLDNEDMEVGAVVRGTANGPALWAERPVSQPEGGQLLENEFVQGDPLGALPLVGNRSPLYLTGAGVAPEAEATLQGLVPIGFRAVIAKVGF